MSTAWIGTATEWNIAWIVKAIASTEHLIVADTASIVGLIVLRHTPRPKARTGWHRAWIGAGIVSSIGWTTKAIESISGWTVAATALTTA